MKENKLITKIKEYFRELYCDVSINSYTIAQIKNSELDILDEIKTTPDAESIQPEQIIDRLKIAIENNEAGFIQDSGDSKAYITIFPFSFPDNEAVIIISSDQKPDEKASRILKFFSLIITEVYRESEESEQKNLSDKYAEEIRSHKEQLAKLREMQAKLFPKFNTVKNFDIAAVFLPADLMTGNFVDGFYLDETTYQVVVCQVAGYDAAASFIGAVIRTLVRSEISKKMVPSQLIETINTKLKNMISDIHALIYLTVYQINTKTGKTLISSYGDLTTIFYNLKKKGYVNLKDTKVGKLLAKRNFYKDISLVLEPEDMLLYYSKGYVESSSEDGTIRYEETKLIENFVHEKAQNSLDIVHSLSESLFEFTNYSPIHEDIILICIKKILKNRRIMKTNKQRKKEF